MKNPFRKEQIKSLRKFTYSKTGVTLSFELNINDKGQMGAFKELLEKSLIDVSEAIDKIEPKKVLVISGGSKAGADPNNGGGGADDMRGAGGSGRPVEREMK